MVSDPASYITLVACVHVSLNYPIVFSGTYCHTSVHRIAALVTWVSGFLKVSGAGGKWCVFPLLQDFSLPQCFLT